MAIVMAMKSSYIHGSQIKRMEIKTPAAAWPDEDVMNHGKLNAVEYCISHTALLPAEWQWHLKLVNFKDREGHRLCIWQPVGPFEIAGSMFVG